MICRLASSTLFPYTTLFRSPSELAARIGCTVGSLRVACSRYGLSLRRHSHKPRSREHYYNQAPQLDEFVLALAEEIRDRSEEHTSELQSLTNLVCRLLLEKK